MEPLDEFQLGLMQQIVENEEQAIMHPQEYAQQQARRKSVYRRERHRFSTRLRYWWDGVRLSMAYRLAGDLLEDEP